MGTGFEPPEEPPAKFGTVRRGYDPMEVDAFLADVASRIRSLEARSRQVTRVATEDDDRLAERLARILKVQEQETESVLTEAHVEASEMVDEAKRDANRIRSAAQDAAERSIGEADAFRERAAEEADLLRSDLAERRREMVERLPQIHQRLLTFQQDVEAMLGSIGAPSRAERPATGEVVDEFTSRA